MADDLPEESSGRIATESRRAADAGLIPSFTDRDSLLAYTRSRANPSE
jgi:hypothetical protein